jgi:hypothetical protein
MPPADRSSDPVESRQVASTGAHVGACNQSIDWYSEGESRVVEVDGVRVTVRLVGRKGRRARIAITAPSGAKFRRVERKVTNADQFQERFK